MTQSAGPLARRTLLRRILGAVGAATIVCASPNAGTAAIKISQKAVAYQDHPEGDKRCEKCVQFQAPNQCKVVDGTINPTSAIRPSARGTMLPKLRLQPDPSAAGFAHHASATGNLTIPIEELTRLAENIYEEFPHSIFFTSKLIFEHDNWYIRQLHSEAALTMLRRLNLRNMPMVILPMKL